MTKSAAIVTIISGLVLVGASTSVSSAAAEHLSAETAATAHAASSVRTPVALRCPSRAWHSPIACAW
jgi:hypothetical protein